MLYMRKILAVLAAFAISLAAAFASDFVRPEYLKKGDKVAIVSPSYVIDDVLLERACNVLRSWGLVPVKGANVGRDVGHVLAGTVEERVADLKWAFSSPEIKAVFCTRGGYGAIQLLESMPLGVCSAGPKWFVGFSDATTLHSALTVAGVMSVHGNNCNEISSSKSKSMQDNDALRDLLFGKAPEYNIPAHACNVQGHAKGRLVGGNMVSYLMMVGTPYDSMSLGDTILFIEETGESLKSIDRMFNALMLHPNFKGVRGIVLGRFSDTTSNYPAQSVEKMVMEYAKKLGIPVCCGFPAGHNGVNMPLVMGAETTMDVTREGTSIRFSL